MGIARNIARLIPNGSGLLPNANIEAVAASKLTGQVPDANAPSGSVIQAVSATTATVVQITTGSWTDTGLSASITPSSASNRILVLVSARHFSQPGTTQRVGLLRNATLIYALDRFGLTDTSTAGSGDYFVASVLDSPATTSAITYKTQFARSGGSGIVFAQLDNANSSIVLLEVSP